MDKPRPHSISPPDTQSPKPPRSGQDSSLPVRNGKELIPRASPRKPIKRAHRRSLQKLAQEEAKRIPDIRQERVDQIRAALQSGEYQISSDLIADRIIQDTLLNESSTED